MKKSTSSALISFLLILCLLLISASAQTPAKCHPQDQIAIDKLVAYFGINFTGDCCDWKPVVSCDYFPPYNRVVFFQVKSLNFSGQIPAAIGGLSYLEYLTFSNMPNLTGNIPPAITKLIKLISITIEFTGISGPFPTFPVNFTSLTGIEIRGNSLTGRIPSELPTWFPNLNLLALENNNLTGTIPESLGNLRSLNGGTLDLSNNSLTGQIPKSLSNLDPSEIDLSGNNFYGDASALFGENKNTGYLYLHANKFIFDLSKVKFALKLREISISYNKIFGSLPQQMTQLIYLKKLDVSHNMLCGEIPQGGLLQGFKVSRYANNKCLCGAPLPACIK